MCCLLGSRARDAVDECTPAACATCLSVTARRVRSCPPISLLQHLHGGLRTRGQLIPPYHPRGSLTLCNRLSRKGDDDAIECTLKEAWMIIKREEDVTRAVLEAMQATPDARLREITTALVKHLHAFAAEVRLT